MHLETLKFSTLPIPAVHNCQIVKLVREITRYDDKLPSVF